MKYTILALVAILALNSAYGVLTHKSYNQQYKPHLYGKEALTGELAFKMYIDFLETYKGVSGNEVLNHMDKFSTFRSNLNEIVEHNMIPSRTYEKGVSQYTDMTADEFVDYFNLKVTAEQNCNALASKPKVYNEEPPASFDWRDEEKVTPVKAQGHCGSCWTFSTAGAMESHFLIHTDRTFANFSEQQLVDCAGDYDCHGCSGGLPSNAFNYIRDNGMTTEEQYDYFAEVHECTYKQSMEAVVTSGPFNITAKDEVQLKEALYNEGPISCAFQVIDGFRDYASGVYQSKVCKNGEKQINHAVLCVGYGHDEESDLDFWSVKNSWGADWGNEGFFQIERGVNMCGIGVCNSYPENVIPVTKFSVAGYLKQAI